MEKVDVITIILSIISLFLSLLAIYLEAHSTKKLNDINLESQFLLDVYKDFLMKELPETRRLLHFSEDGIDNPEILQILLTSVVKESRFFKYSDSYFYYELKRVCQDLEDYIVSIDKKVYDEDDRIKMKNELDKKIEKIYITINNKYKNGNYKSIWAKIKAFFTTHTKGHRSN